jgi:NAD(P)-dependent dehydrogenase (short-subunit alcohol dehydrogenase family)
MSDPDMEGRVCLVTGATSGHGRALAGLLADRGAELVLLGRNPELCNETADEIEARSGGKRPEILLCDLSRMDDVKRAASEFLATGRPLHVLINNAAVVTLGRQESAEGYELGFAVNYLAHFTLTLLLVPRLRQSAPARVVYIASDAHRTGRLDLDDLQLEGRYSVARSYCRSKAAVIYSSIELARRLANTGVTVNAVDPGPIASKIGSNNQGLAYRLVGPIIRATFPSAAKAARTPLHLATAPELVDRTGTYWKFMRERTPRAPDAETIGPELWKRSLSLAGIDDLDLGVA